MPAGLFAMFYFTCGLFSRIFCVCGLVEENLLCLRACLRCFSSHAGLFTRVYCACGLVFRCFILHAGLVRRISCACGLFCACGFDYEILLCLRVRLRVFILPAGLITRFYYACGFDYEILLCMRVLITRLYCVCLPDFSFFVVLAGVFTRFLLCLRI